MKIKNVKIDGKLILAPMAGITDKAFRTICKEFGASLTISEMISAKALTFSDKKTLKLMQKDVSETPYSVQTFGHEPEVFKQAIPLIIEHSNCDIIDINMGCPAPKITSNGEGSALMKNPDLAFDIIETAVKASSVPITVKFRKGFTNCNQNYLEFAKMAEQAGASAICLHGRTRTQMYSGNADWDAISEIKKAVKIPVIANGDVTSGSVCKDILNHTNADFVMIGRATFGNPFIFEDCTKTLNGTHFTQKTLEEKLEVFVKQMKLTVLDKSEKVAMLEARKHFAWYLKGENNMKHFKQEINNITTLDDMNSIISKILNTQEV